MERSIKDVKAEIFNKGKNFKDSTLQSIHKDSNVSIESIKRVPERAYPMTIEGVKNRLGYTYKKLSELIDIPEITLKRNKDLHTKYAATIIRQIRYNNKWTQDEYAQKLGIDISEVKLMEHDNIRSPWTKIMDIIRELTGYTGDRFAHVFGVNKKTVSFWYNDEMHPTLHHMILAYDWVQMLEPLFPTKAEYERHLQLFREMDLPAFNALYTIGDFDR